VAKRDEAPDMIQEFESAAEGMAHWIANHALLVGGGVALLLLGALAFGVHANWKHDREAAASGALERTRAAYLSALGAPPGALEPPVLANPEAARSIQEDYLARFQAIADENPGTVGGTLALFETAELLDALGRGDQTAAVWERAIAAASGNPALEGMLRQRVGQAHEAHGEWAEAAAAHAAAAEIVGYPLRYWAMADAARCYAAAGDSEHALALYERIEREAPELPLAPHQRAQLRELRAVAAR